MVEYIIKLVNANFGDAMMSLANVKHGNSVKIESLACDGKTKQRLIDLGIYKGESVKVKAVAPLGDPMIIEIKDCEIAIRKNDAKKIIVA